METQIKQILEYLKSGNSLTKQEALFMFGCWNSGDVIYKLRRPPYSLNIKTEMVNGVSRGREVTFARYSLIIEK